MHSTSLQFNFLADEMYKWQTSLPVILLCSLKIKTNDLVELEVIKKSMKVFVWLGGLVLVCFCFVVVIVVCLLAVYCW